MENEILKMIDDEIITLMERIQAVAYESEEYKIMMDEITTLHQLRMDEIRAINDRDKDQALLNMEYFKIEQEQNTKYDEAKTKSEEEKSNRRFNLGIQILKTTVEVCAVVAPLAFYALWMERGFEYEKEGSYSSKTFMNLIQKFKPTK